MALRAARDCTAPAAGIVAEVEARVLTIAGYNAGKARVLAWTTAHGDPRDAKVDVVDWIEAIPFDETRNYVMRVLENNLAYKTRRNEPLHPQELNQILRPTPLNR